MKIDLSPLKKDLTDLVTGHHRGWFGKSSWFQSEDYKVYARVGTIRHPTKMGDMVHALTLANFSVTEEGRGLGTAIVKLFCEVAREQGRILYVENAFAATAHICAREGLQLYRQSNGNPIPCYYLEP